MNNALLIKLRGVIKEMISRKKLGLQFIIVVIVLATITLALFQIKVYAEGNRGINVGDYAHDFSLTNLDGEEESLSDYLGKKVAINFWAIWCPPCREGKPNLDDFHAKYDDLVVLKVKK